MSRKTCPEKKARKAAAREQVLAEVQAQKEAFKAIATECLDMGPRRRLRSDVLAVSSLLMMTTGTGKIIG